MTITAIMGDAISTCISEGGCPSRVDALIAIRDEAQAQLVALKSSMLPQLRAQIAALEAVEAKVGRRKGSKNKPKQEVVAQ